jgi:hypothetical protein
MRPHALSWTGVRWCGCAVVYAKPYAQAAAEKAEIDTLNQQRKLEQEATGTQLRALEAEWYELVVKNKAIEAAIADTQQKLAALQGDPKGGGDDSMQE